MTLIEPNTTAELTAGDPNTLALRVCLEWQADRFTHAIYLVEAGNAVLLFSPADESTDDAWPLHPPLQQASIEEIQGRLAILGVGLAGRSHWSVSIETLDEDGPALRFDYACKCSDKPKYLGSRYHWAKEIEGNTDAFAGILCSAGEQFIQISPDDDGTSATCCKEDSWWEVCPETGEETVRWKYQIRLM